MLPRGRPCKYPEMTQAAEDRRAFGIPYDGYLAYCAQFHNSLRRGIELRFTLPEWWEWWQEPHELGDSTRWNRRGRRKGSAMMLRNGDLGHYEPGNVYCGTPADNMHDLKRRPPTDAQRLASAANGKRLGALMASRLMRPVTGPHGSFPSVQDAAEAVGVNRRSVERWCRAGRGGWRYDR